MTIEEFCEIADLEIEIRYAANQAGPWISRLRSSQGAVHVKDSAESSLIGTCTGWGACPDSSLCNMIQHLNQAKLVVVDGPEGRRKIPVPKSIK